MKLSHFPGTSVDFNNGQALGECSFFRGNGDLTLFHHERDSLLRRNAITSLRERRRCTASLCDPPVLRGVSPAHGAETRRFRFTPAVVVGPFVLLVVLTLVFGYLCWLGPTVDCFIGVLGWLMIFYGLSGQMHGERMRSARRLQGDVSTRGQPCLGGSRFHSATPLSGRFGSWSTCCPSFSAVCGLACDCGLA